MRVYTDIQIVFIFSTSPNLRIILCIADTKRRKEKKKCDKKHSSFKKRNEKGKRKKEIQYEL